MPFYLKNTIFDETELVVSNRQQDMMTRFMVAIELKEIANKSYYDSNYKQALEIYQYSLSVLRYLDTSYYIYNNSILKYTRTKQTANPDHDYYRQQMKQYEKELQKYEGVQESNKKYISVFIDDNVEEMRNLENMGQNELNLYYSLLLQIQSNMAACLMKLGHLEQAR